MVENSGRENFSHCHTFVDELHQVVLEKMGVDVRILILHDIVNHHVDRSNLIVLKRNING